MLERDIQPRAQLEERDKYFEEEIRKNISLWMRQSSKEM